MIQRFRFGLPLPTDSVVQEIPVSAGPVPFLTFLLWCAQFSAH